MYNYKIILNTIENVIEFVETDWKNAIAKIHAVDTRKLI